MTILGMTLYMWLSWAALLLCQNFAFTFVSRARNSGSMRRHLIAGIFSNGVWFSSQIFAVNAFLSILTGKYGLPASIFAGLFYTALTLTGSIVAHYYALRSEKGTGRVGAHKDVATFTKAEGDMLRKRTLLVDTGDGNGAFTPSDVLKLQELIGRVPTLVVEKITETFLPRTDRANGDFTWLPKDIRTIPVARPGQGAKL